MSGRFILSLSLYLSLFPSVFHHFWEEALGSKPYTFPAADAEPNHEGVQRGRQQGWLDRNNAPPWWTGILSCLHVVCWPCHIRLQNMIFVNEAPIMQQSNSMWLEPCHQASGRWSWHMTSTELFCMPEPSLKSSGTVAPTWESEQ